MYLEIGKNEVKYNQFLDVLYKLYSMFANNLIKPKGKEATSITLVTGFLSQGVEVCHGFCMCEENKKGWGKVFIVFLSKYISKYFDFKS